jgi:adenine phosphoribosyltransferase
MTLNACIATRLNVPKRARRERIINECDGICGAVSPDRLLAVAQELWARASAGFPELPDILVGLDNGGVVLTVGLAIVSGVKYKLGYKLDLDLPRKIEIVEPYAVSPQVYFYDLTPGSSVFIVDDEVCSGETACNAVDALRAAGVSVLAVLCLVEVDSYGAREKIESRGVPLFSVTTLSLDREEK